MLQVPKFYQSKSINDNITQVGVKRIKSWNEGQERCVKKRISLQSWDKSSDVIKDKIDSFQLQKTPSEEDVQLIKQTLANHCIFQEISEASITRMIDNMKFFEINQNVVLFNQGDEAFYFYIIHSGSIEVIIDNKPKGKLGPGESFGELALVHNSKRTATIQTIEKSQFWGIDRKTFKEVLRHYNDQNQTVFKQFMNQVPSLSALSENQQDLLLHQFNLHVYKAEDYIVNEGDEGNSLFFIKEGTVTCLQNGNVIRTMNQGEFFGEQALMNNTVRTATIQAASRVECISISGDQLRLVFGYDLQKLLQKNSWWISIEKDQLFSNLNESQANAIFSKMSFRNYCPEDIIMRSSKDFGSKLIVVFSGVIQYKFRDYGQFVIFQPQKFLENQEQLKSNLTAKKDCLIGEVSRYDFDSILGQPFHQIIQQNEALSLIQQISFFQYLTYDTKEQLVGLLQRETFEQGQTIINQGTIGDKFYLIKSGVVNIIKDGQHVRSITVNNYFGERALLLSSKRTASVVAQTNVICQTLSNSDFQSLIDDNMKYELLKRIEFQDDSIELSDLAIIEEVGQGSFGHVFLAAHKDKRTLYALKTISRRKIAQYDLYDAVVRERQILLLLDHIFISKIVKTFKDEDRVYYLLEYIRGQELFFVMGQMGLLKEEQAKFYIGAIIEMIIHLHQRKIVYRDLKPENIMVDVEGTPKLIDFGISKIIEGRTYTVIGTPNYMAPEVILGEGYTTYSDYWSIGIILFEMICGQVPFGEEEENPQQIYYEVLQGQIEFPNWVTNETTRNFIFKLLSRNPTLRSLRIKEDPWWQGFNFDDLLSKQITPPFKPAIRVNNANIMSAIRRNRPYKQIINQAEIDDIAKGRLIDPPRQNWDEEF